jgi:hypothetical protein
VNYHLCKTFETPQCTQITWASRWSDMMPLQSENISWLIVVLFCFPVYFFCFYHQTCMKDEEHSHILPAKLAHSH